MGYSECHKGYKYLSPSGKLYIARTFIFNETEFLYSALFLLSLLQQNPHLHHIIQLLFLLIKFSLPHLLLLISLPLNLVLHHHHLLATLLYLLKFKNPLIAPIQSGHPMITRSKARIYKPKVCTTHVSTQSSFTEPKIVTEALATPDWKSAMEAKYQALIANQTWTLVLLPPSSTQNLLRNKWVFKIKHNTDGSVNRLRQDW